MKRGNKEGTKHYACEVSGCLKAFLWLICIATTADQLCTVRQLLDQSTGTARPSFLISENLQAEVNHAARVKTIATRVAHTVERVGPQEVR